MTKGVWQVNQTNTSLLCNLTDSGGVIVIGARDVSARAALEQWTSLLTRDLQSNKLDRLFSVMNRDEKFIAEVSDRGGIGFAVRSDGPNVYITITASDQRSRTAIHEFMRAQGNCIPTNRAINHPGNNLGWDAPPGPDLKK